MSSIFVFFQIGSNKQRQKRSAINNDDSSDEDSSSSDASSEETNNKMSDTPAVADEKTDLLYEKGTFATCRSASDSFYLCQIRHDVYAHTKSIRIRWCVVLGEDGDDTQITIKTQFQLDYMDNLDPETILLDIPDPIIHDDDTISLKKQHIVDTKRLLEKSIRNELSSPDDMMDLSTEHRKKSPKNKSSGHIRFDSDSEGDQSVSSASTIPVTPKSNKRKKAVTEKKPRRQPAKRQRRTKNVADATDGEDKPAKPKKKRMHRQLIIRY